MNKYDYIIAGGGCAGLSLAIRLLNSPLKEKRILIIDAESKNRNDRTWSFWSKKVDPLFEPIIYKKWEDLVFADENQVTKSTISPYFYQLIRGIDFYQYAEALLAKSNHVDRLKAHISHLGEDATGAYVWAGNQVYHAKYVFNSCFQRKDLQPETPNSYFLLQHFLGWRIKVDRPIFNPNEAVLMDFRGPQHGNARFYYVLPFSETEALVEYTLFSESTIPKEEYRDALRSYLQKQFDTTEFEIIEEEYGVIPMTNRALSSLTSNPHVIQIGTRSGAVKPTTGYAFLRIQQQTQALVEQLLAGKPSGALLSSKSRFRFYDKLLLHILQEEGHTAKQIFRQLFHRNPMTRILTFLDEKSTLWQEIQIFASLPMNPFLKALFKTQLQTMLQRWKSSNQTIELKQVK